MYMYQTLDSNCPIDKIIILTHRCQETKQVYFISKQATIGHFARDPEILVG